MQLLIQNASRSSRQQAPRTPKRCTGLRTADGGGVHEHPVAAVALTNSAGAAGSVVLQRSAIDYMNSSMMTTPGAPSPPV